MNISVIKALFHFEGLTLIYNLLTSLLITTRSSLKVRFSNFCYSRQNIFG